MYVRWTTMEQKTINLRKLRGERTLEQVRDMTGLSISLISKIENNKSPISEKSARKLGQFYGVEIPTTKIKYEVTSTEYKMLNKASELRTANVALAEQNRKLRLEKETLQSELRKISIEFEKLTTELVRVVNGVVFEDVR